MSVKHAVSLAVLLVIVGCAGPDPADTAKPMTMTTRRGRDFDTSKVKDIQKGKTTTQEIIQWFGQPYAKKVVSTNQVGWLYAWKQSTVTVNKAKTQGKETGFRKRLELLISEEVVLNYTFDEGPFDAAADREIK